MKKLLLMIVLVTFGCLNVVAAREDTVEAIKDKSREFLLQKKYLNFPVRNGAEKRLIHLIIDNKWYGIRDRACHDEPDSGVLDISDFAGKSNCV
jgi:hypothetical protein